ncbi:MAG: peptide chain release factor N(5)-glutamine methyltransferase [Oligoflexia bacterium]|nr:peptide chain release factor N(5)-glutamine methyltransferase [Oligoflexia bacterium]
MSATIAAILRTATEQLLTVSPSARLDSELLLAHVLGTNRVGLILKANSSVSEDQLARFEQLVARRANFEPVAYLTGHREFFGLDFEVSPEVLIPRPETELLVELAVKFAATLNPPISILDLGTGSGCIAISIADQLRDRKQITIQAVDRSAQALAIAKRNSERLGTEITFLESDWFSAFSGLDQRFDLIVSNPPYIAVGATDTSPELKHEPQGALYSSGEQGVDAVLKLCSELPRYLRKEGVFFCEIGAAQASLISERLAGAGFEIKFHPDLAGIKRVLQCALTY